MTNAVAPIPHSTLHIRQLPAVNDTGREPLVLLHGWGSDSRVFDDFATRLAEYHRVILVDLPGFGGSELWPQVTLDTVLAALGSQLPERFSLLGWSLGGMLATAFCDRHPHRVSRLVTLAANACFVASGQWPDAMPEKTFKQFCQFFEASPQACLKQFVGLQTQGDSQQRALMKTLRGFMPSSPQESNRNWCQALALLGEIDNRTALTHLKLPGLHLFADGDALVPVAAAQQIASLNPAQQVQQIASSSHCVFYSQQEQVAARIHDFLHAEDKHRNNLDKQQVAQSFSRAAQSYDAAADLQRKVADQVLARTSNVSRPKTILDVGCGTGYLSAGMRQQCADAHLTALDLAPGMLAYASKERPVANRWVCADAESLPLPDNSIDLAVSSLTYQWCQQPWLWAAELYRVLTRRGAAVFSTFGPDTLSELRQAWQAVDSGVHVNQFLPVDALQHYLQQAGFDCQLHVETIVPTYTDLKALMRELKAIGAHNINQGRHSGLTGRQKIRGLIDAYEQFRDANGRLPASYQVVYAVVNKHEA